MSERKDNQGSTLSVAYNNAGQPLSYGDQHFKYINGQIVEVYRLVAGREQVIAEYQYNEVGQRISKTVFEDRNKQRLTQPETRYFVYEGSLLLHELNAEGRITRHYVYMGEQLVATVDYAGQGSALEQDAPSAWNKVKQVVSSTLGKDQPQAVWNYVLTDHLGRPRLVIDEQQKMKWRFAATSFGGTGQAINTVAGQHPFEMPIRFKGQYADAETQLYYNGWRYYDPATGRFTTPDPLGLKGGENLYGYVNQQPVQYDDPQGLLLFAFDGTGNQAFDKDPALTEDQKKVFEQKCQGSLGCDQRDSNVARFLASYGTAKDNGDTTGIETSTTRWTNQKGTFADLDGITNNDAFYISGVGTLDHTTNIGPEGEIAAGIDSGIDVTDTNRVDQMLVYMSDYLKKVMKSQQDAKARGSMQAQTINLDVVGFSRGAAEARMFSSKLENLLDNNYSMMDSYLQPYASKPLSLNAWGKINDCKLKELGISLNFRFEGLWDTVPAAGVMTSNDVLLSSLASRSLQVSSKFKYVAAAIADNETRANFNALSIYTSEADANVNNTDRTAIAKNLAIGENVRIEQGFLGVHSDIGGGYNDGDLSNVALMWMIDQARNMGVKFDDSDSGAIKARGYNVVSNPIVHDSTALPRAATNITSTGSAIGAALMLPGRQFKWASMNPFATTTTQQYTGMTPEQIFDAGGAPDFNDTVSHLGLNWSQTLQFQADKQTKFQQQLTDQQKIQLYSTASVLGVGVCGSMASAICTPLADYQKLKTNETESSGERLDSKDPKVKIPQADLTILYDTSLKSEEGIQITNYINWIKTNYGTNLTYKQAGNLSSK